MNKLTVLLDDHSFEQKPTPQGGALTRSFGGDPCTNDRSRLFYGAKRPLLQLGLNVSPETAERFLREWSADG